MVSRVDNSGGNLGDVHWNIGSQRNKNNDRILETGIDIMIGKREFCG
jgi:hypothetical protein